MTKQSSVRAGHRLGWFLIALQLSLPLFFAAHVWAERLEAQADARAGRSHPAHDENTCQICQTIGQCRVALVTPTLSILSIAPQPTFDRPTDLISLPRQSLLLGERFARGPPVV